MSARARRGGTKPLVSHVIPIRFVVGVPPIVAMFNLEILPVFPERMTPVGING